MSTKKIVLADNKKSQDEKDKEQIEKDRKQLELVVNAIQRVDQEINKSIFQMANGMTEIEIIQQFNQGALDAFETIDKITKQMKKEKDYSIKGYKVIFEQAIGINKRLPIDKFTLIILEFAPEIYSENDQHFLKMMIPDAEIQVGNEFSFIRSESFKQLWLEMSDKNKEKTKEAIINITSLAHCFLYKTISKKN